MDEPCTTLIIKIATLVAEQPVIWLTIGLVAAVAVIHWQSSRSKELEKEIAKLKGECARLRKQRPF